MSKEDYRAKKVLVVDDAAATRERLCTLLAEQVPAESVGCPASPWEVHRLVEELRPDCIVIDVPVHDAQGFGLLEEIRTVTPSLIVVLTHHDSEEFKLRSVSAGADYVFNKAMDLRRAVGILREMRHPQ